MGLMADRIMHNPHLEVMPDHSAGPHYDALQEALVQNGMLAEQPGQPVQEFMDYEPRCLCSTSMGSTSG